MDLVVQEGYWFSAHEQWKLWTLPYLDIPLLLGVFASTEVARTRFSSERDFPGLRASANAVPNGPSGCSVGYLSACGVKRVASQNVTCTDVVTPYAASPLFAIAAALQSRNASTAEHWEAAAVSWYAAMLNGTKMQGPLGSTEASAVQADLISPFLTWDTKINPLVAYLGGTSQLVKDGLIAEGRWGRFTETIQALYEPVFPNATHWVDVLPSLPTRTLPHHPGFTPTSFTPL
mmetsp:Transcript_75347/g.176896  ORF Transcript_75347/g.176896 Transcript_75347/m.176896 type:complete len:233 (+) Transcript_75347:109-807(+)